MTCDGEKKIPWRRLLIGEWNWKRPFKLILFVYVVLLVIALFFPKYFLFPYQQSSYAANLSGLVLLKSEDDTTLATRYWKANAEEKGLIVYFHGNAEDLGMLGGVARQLTSQGFSVLSMDYRGYGLSGGSPSEENCYEDAEVLYRYALQLGYREEHIILWGRSLGSGVAVELAKRKKVRALVLESAFCTAFRTATHLPLLPFDQFDNLSKISAIDEPLFVIHGAKDTTIRPWHSEKLFAEHSGRKRRVLLPAVDHNNLWIGQVSAVIQEMEAFVAEGEPHHN